MEELEIKKVLSANLTKLRKHHKLTQGELAEKINYSDKTISKWENGDAIPDTETLYRLSRFYGVSMDQLVARPIDVVPQPSKEEDPTRFNKLVITLLAISLVWLIATILYIQFVIILDTNIWMFFIWAIPVTCIVWLVFNCIWGKRVWTYIAISMLVWTALLSIYLQVIQYNIWYVFFLGLPLQIATILWSQLKVKKGE